MLKDWSYEEMKDGRDSEVLLKAIDQIELLEKRLEIAKAALERYNMTEWRYCQYNNEIAEKALEAINNVRSE